MFDDTGRQAIITDIALDITRAHRFIRDKLDIATADMSKRDRHRIARITRDRDDVRMLSQFHVGEASQLALVDALLAHFDPHRHEPGFRYWMGTFCLDDGVVHVGDGYLSPQAIKALKLKVYKVLHHFGLHAVLSVEIEILLRIKGESSPRFMYHIHAACWRHGDPIKPRQLAAAMSGGTRFRNSLGARPIVFTTNRWSAAEGTPKLAQRVRRCRPSDRSVAGLGGYITKWPVCVKVLKPVRNRPGRHRLQPDRTKNSAALVLALTEARSRLDVLDTVMGVGKGCSVRTAWKQGLETRLR